MTDKPTGHMRQLYQSNILALPPLKMVLGDIPEPDPDERHRTFRTLNLAKTEAEARDMVSKIIGHLKDNEK